MGASKCQELSDSGVEQSRANAAVNFSLMSSRPRSRRTNQAVETLLREGLGRVGEAEVVEPKIPRSTAEVQALGWNELSLIFATTYAPAIREVVDHGDEALRAELERWEPENRAALARALAAVG